MQDNSNLIEFTLTSLGFNDKDVKVYLALLKLGKCKVKDILEETGDKKGNTYNILYEFENQGLVTQHKQGGVAVFQVEPPTKLYELYQTRREKLEMVGANLKASMKELESAYQLSVGKPTIQFYEGKGGLEQISKDIMADEQEGTVYGCVNLDRLRDAIPEYFETNLVTDRTEKDIFSVALVNDTEFARRQSRSDEDASRDVIFIDDKEYPFPSEIDVYKDRVALMTFDGETPISILIHNKAIAQSMRSLLKLAARQKETGKE